MDNVQFNETNENGALQSLDQRLEDTILLVKMIKSVEVDKHKTFVHCSAKFPVGIETNVVKCFAIECYLMLVNNLSHAI